MKKILVVDDDPVIQKLVTGLLIKAGYQVGSAENGKEGLSQLDNFKPDLIISDVLMPEMDGYEFCKKVRIIPELGNIPIILLTSLDTIDQKIKGFEVGADDYVVKPLEPKEFLARISALLKRSGQILIDSIETKEAKIIGVFSLRGGSGVSSLAVNISISLSQIWNKPTTLVDLVMTGGQSALYLNQPLKHTWDDLAQFPVEEIGEGLIESTLLHHESGITTLAAPKRPELSEILSSVYVPNVLSILKNIKEYIILDLPHDFSEIALAGLDNSDIILLVIQPEIISIRSTIMALDIFAELGYDMNSIYLILNWTFPKKGISLEDIERVIKKKIDVVIPYASEEFIDSINYGKPPAFFNPEKSLGIIFEDMALALSKEDHRMDRPENPSDAWERTAKRYKKRRK